MEYAVKLVEDQPAGREGEVVMCSDQIDPAPGFLVLVAHPEKGPVITSWPSRYPWMATLNRAQEESSARGGSRSV